MKTVKLILVALLFVACGGNGGTNTQQKKTDKVVTTKKMVKKNTVVGEAKTTVLETNTDVAETATDVPVKKGNTCKDEMRNEEFVEYAIPEEKIITPSAASVQNVNEEPSYTQVAEVVEKEEEKEVEVKAPVSKNTVSAPVEQPSIDEVAEVLDKPEVEVQSGFKNRHSLSGAIGVYKFWSKNTYYNPIPSLELGYTCVAEAYDSNFYTEIGANIMFAYGNISKERQLDSNVIVRASMLSVSIPFNFGYNIRIKEDWSLSPYIGVLQRIYILGNTKTIVKVGDNVEKTRANLFDGRKGNANRHQLGLHAGLKLTHKKYSYGAVFGYDLLEFDSNRNVMTWGLTFGYTF